MKSIVLISFFAVLGAALFLFLASRTIILQPTSAVAPLINHTANNRGNNLPLPTEPEAPTSPPPAKKNANAVSDLSSQLPLANPPAVVKGIYVTGWSAGSASRVDSLISLTRRMKLNAMVIDIKDFSGHVSYRTGIAEVAATGAENEIKIAQPNALIKKLHDAGIYTIGRVTVFQDPVLAKAHPEWALKNKPTGKIWTDNKGLAWMDPAAEPVWDHNLSIIKDALARGFDEINFDYIRFASDGNLENISYPFWDGVAAKHGVIKNFLGYLRKNLPGAKISGDVFGLTTIAADDLGIGQVIEDAYISLDYVSPMVYPSHYRRGVFGYSNPAQHPYEVVRNSLDGALKRLESLEGAVEGPKSLAKLRPWLQVFDLGAVYNRPMVEKQIQAAEDVLLRRGSSSSTPVEKSYFGGWLLWDPSNIYKGYSE